MCINLCAMYIKNMLANQKFRILIFCNRPPNMIMRRSMA